MKEGEESRSRYSIVHGKVDEGIRTRYKNEGEKCRVRERGKALQNLRSREGKSKKERLNGDLKKGNRRGGNGRGEKHLIFPLMKEVLEFQ